MNDTARVLRVEVVGSVSSGKTALVHYLSRELSATRNLAVVTNGIYTR